MNGIAPFAVGSSGASLGEPDRPLLGRDREIFRYDFRNLATAPDRAVGDISQPEESDAHESVDEEFADGWNRDRAEDSLQNAN